MGELAPPKFWGYGLTGEDKKHTTFTRTFRKVRANFSLLSCDASQEPKGNCSEKLVQMNFFILGGFFGWIFLLWSMYRCSRFGTIFLSAPKPPLSKAKSLFLLSSRRLWFCSLCIIFVTMVWLVLPALLQKLVGDFFLIFRGEIWEIWWEIWREFSGIFSDPQNKGSKISGKISEHFS